MTPQRMLYLHNAAEVKKIKARRYKENGGIERNTHDDKVYLLVVNQWNARSYPTNDKI